MTTKPTMTYAATSFTTRLCLVLVLRLQFSDPQPRPGTKGDSRQTAFHNKQTAFDQPDGDQLHLFGHDDHLATKRSLRHNFRGKLYEPIGGIDEVAASPGNDVDAYDQSSVGALGGGVSGSQRRAWEV